MKSLLLLLTLAGLCAAAKNRQLGDALGYGEPNAEEQELMKDWPANYKASTSVDGQPENAFRQRCRLRKYHYANDTGGTGCNSQVCIADRDQMLAEGKTCTVACCSYCAEDMPSSQRIGMVALKGGMQLFFTYVIYKTVATAKPHFSQALSSGKLMGTLTILVSMIVCAVFYWIMSFPWFLYHVVLLGNGGNAEFYSFDTLSKAWDPNLNMICTVSFVLAQLNLIFLWEEMICPDDSANKMKSIHNVQSSVRFIKYLLIIYVLVQIGAVAAALVLRFYILSIIVTMLTWLSLQCYVSCKFIRSSGKIIKELTLASSSTGGNKGLNDLILKVTKVVRAVGGYGYLIIITLFSPMVMITAGVLFRIKTSPMSAQWPSGGETRCHLEVFNEFIRTIRKIFHMMVLLKIAEVLAVKELSSKGGKTKAQETVVSAGHDTDDSSKSSATSN